MVAGTHSSNGPETETVSFSVAVDVVRRAWQRGEGGEDASVSCVLTRARGWV